MDNREIENKLQESADNIEVRDFSQVWEDIKYQVKPIKKKRRINWLPKVAAFVGIIICAVFVPIIINQINKTNTPEEVIYFDDELLTESVLSNEFSQQLSSVNIVIADTSDYFIVSSYVFKTLDGVIVGGRLELVDDANTSTFYSIIKIYDKLVKLIEDKNIKYDYTYTINNQTINYRIKEAYPSDNIYVYEISTEYKGMNYRIEHTCSDEDIKPFLNEFFDWINIIKIRFKKYILERIFL